jgi:hypothetical protein
MGTRAPTLAKKAMCDLQENGPNVARSSVVQKNIGSQIVLFFQTYRA